MALGVAVAIALVVGSCGSDDDSTADTGAETDTTENACPSDGCEITITSVEAAGDELTVSWDTNFAPDVSKNHIHIYWDTFTAAQVSNDAADQGLEQGEWVPTDATPSYTTEGATSMSVRGDSTTLCVTAGDRDHNVIDASIVSCQDVADLL